MTHLCSIFGPLVCPDVAPRCMASCPFCGDAAARIWERTVEIRTDARATLSRPEIERRGHASLTRRSLGRHALRTIHAVTPTPRCNPSVITDRSFQYVSPRLWNQLPAPLRQPRTNLSSSASPSCMSGTSSIGSIDSPLSSSITPLLFHSRLKLSFSANPSHHSLPFLLMD